MQPKPKTIYAFEPTGLKQIYKRFLQHNRCRDLFEVLNYYSRFDALINSGDTKSSSTVVIEYKDRGSVAIHTYDSALLEEEKYLALMKVKDLTKSPVLYIMEFEDAILIYELSENDNYKWHSMQVRSNNDGYESEMKEVTLIPYEKATWIISKRTWERRSAKQLFKYVKEQRNGQG